MNCETELQCFLNGTKSSTSVTQQTRATTETAAGPANPDTGECINPIYLFNYKLIYLF